MNGPKAAAALSKAAFDPCPPGYTRSAAGQLVLADHDLICRIFTEICPALPLKRSMRPGGEDF